MPQDGGQCRDARGPGRAAGPTDTHSHGALSPDAGPNTWPRPEGAWELVGTEAGEAGLGGTGVWGPSAPVTQPAGRTCRGLPCRLGAAERRPGERMGRRHGGVSYTRSSWEPARVSSKDLVLGEPLPRGRGGSPETGVTCPLELGHGLGTACRSASLRPTWSVPGPVDFCRAAATQGSRPAGGSRWGRPGGNVTVAAQRGPSALVGAARGGHPETDGRAAGPGPRRSTPATPRGISAPSPSPIVYVGGA